MRFSELPRAEALCALDCMVGVPKWDTGGGLQGADDIVGGGRAFLALDDDGTQLVLFVVEQVAHEHGRELVIRVARQLAAAGDLTARVLPAIESVFGLGCDAVTLYTRRAGLVRKLEKQGYQEAAKIMRKKINQ